MRRLAINASKTDAFQLLSIEFPTWENIDPWVRNHFRYAQEPYEIILHPNLVLETIRNQGYLVGDCDDVATFEAAIFKTYGYPVRFVAIRTFIHDPNFQHVFIEVNINGNWIVFDPTVRPGLIHRQFGRMEVYV